jgi:hypothetical protein
VHVLIWRHAEGRQQGNTKRKRDDATHQHAIIHE